MMQQTKLAGLAPKYGIYEFWCAPDFILWHNVNYQWRPKNIIAQFYFGSTTKKYCQPNSDFIF